MRIVALVILAGFVAVTDAAYAGAPWPFSVSGGVSSSAGGVNIEASKLSGQISVTGAQINVSKLNAQVLQQGAQIEVSKIVGYVAVKPMLPSLIPWQPMTHW